VGRRPGGLLGLRTEYIGIMYEGLLDYELKRVPADSPTVVLALGKEPVLPLSLLEGLSTPTCGT